MDARKLIVDMTNESKFVDPYAVQPQEKTIAIPFPSFDFIMPSGLHVIVHR